MWRSRIQKTLFLATGIVFAVLATLFIRSRQDADAIDAVMANGDAETVDEPLTITNLIKVAEEVRQNLSENVDDYTVRFLKQDRDTTGVLQPQETLFLKIKSPVTDADPPQSLRVYLKALAPKSKQGQEVIWSKDLFDGKLCAHLTGIMGIKRMYVDPTSMFAMVGQRHPISEIGMANLVDTLIKRAEQYRENPHVSIVRTSDFQHGDLSLDLYQVACSQPVGGEDDFSRFEVGFDRERDLMMIYRTYGWPEQEGDERPLLEAYAYEDVRINVGLSDEDFDPDNPEYDYPKF